MLHRGHESTGDGDGGEPAVPMAWFCAEFIADELLRTGDLMPPSSVEYRADTRYVAPVCPVPMLVTCTSATSAPSTEPSH